MSKVEVRFKGLMLVSLIMVLIDISVGLLLNQYLKFTMKSTAVIVGSVMLLHGMFYLIRYIYDGLGKKVFNMDLIVAVMDIVLGIFTFIYNFNSTNEIGVAFAFYFFSNCLEKGYYGVKFMKEKDSAYPVVFFMAIALLIMGVLVMFNPFSRFMLVTRLAGMFLVCSGIIDGMICKMFFDKSGSFLKMFN